MTREEYLKEYPLKYTYVNREKIYYNIMTEDPINIDSFPVEIDFVVYGCPSFLADSRYFYKIR